MRAVQQEDGQCERIYPVADRWVRDGLGIFLHDGCWRWNRDIFLEWGRVGVLGVPHGSSLGL